MIGIKQTMDLIWAKYKWAERQKNHGYWAKYRFEISKEIEESKQKKNVGLQTMDLLKK